MNSENNHEINLRQVLSLRAFKELLKNPPHELYNMIGEEGFLEIAKFLSNIPSEDQLNPAEMVKHIGSYCYQPGHEVLKEFYLKTYQSINSKDIQAVVKKTGDAGDRPSMTSVSNLVVAEEVLQSCKSMQHWAIEFLKHNRQKPELMERLAELLGGSENALIWLNSPHPVLDNRTPKSYVQEGKLEVLEYFIHAIETGQPS